MKVLVKNLSYEGFKTFIEKRSIDGLWSKDTAMTCIMLRNRIEEESNKKFFLFKKKEKYKLFEKYKTTYFGEYFTFDI